MYRHLRLPLISWLQLAAPIPLPLSLTINGVFQYALGFMLIPIWAEWEAVLPCCWISYVHYICFIYNQTSRDPVG